MQIQAAASRGSVWSAATTEEKIRDEGGLT